MAPEASFGAPSEWFRKLKEVKSTGIWRGTLTLDAPWSVPLSLHSTSPFSVVKAREVIALGTGIVFTVLFIERHIDRKYKDGQAFLTEEIVKSEGRTMAAIGAVKTDVTKLIKASTKLIEASEGRTAAAIVASEGRTAAAIVASEGRTAAAITALSALLLGPRAGPGPVSPGPGAQ